MSEGAISWQPPALRVVNPVADKLTFEQELEQARLQGYQEGLRQGLDEGRQQARNTLAEMSALWDAMQEPFADMEHEVHSTLLGLSVALAKAVLRRELKTDREMMSQALSLALDALGHTRHELEVELNPRDVDLVRSLLADQAQEPRLKQNPNMMPGGCRLRSGSALVDATIESMVCTALEKITNRSRLTDESGAELAIPMSAEEVAAIARRFEGSDDVN